YRGELLPEARYESWTAAPRERLHRLYIRLLDLLSADAMTRGDAEEAVRLLERALEAEPMDESRYVAAARIRIEQGRRVAARSLLRQARAVAADLGLAASAEVTDLEHRLETTVPPVSDR